MALPSFIPYLSKLLRSQNIHHSAVASENDEKGRMSKEVIVVNLRHIPPFD
jgi:hypothetical protein